MKKLKVLSLFNGMNCGGMALKSAGFEFELYASEIDKHANKISSLLFPETINLGDVRTVKISEIGKIDLLLAGSPCQGFSFAGKQLNFEDERSKLFFEFIRILKEARALNPEVKFLLENVKMKAEHQAIISRFCGIDPIEINSALLSAQNRRRLYWTNIGTNKANLFGIEQPGIKQPKDKGILLKYVLESEVDEKYFLSDKVLNFVINPMRLAKKFTQINGNKSLTMLSRQYSNWNGTFIKTDRKGKPKKNQNKASCFTAGGNSGGNHSDMDLLIIPESTKKGYAEIEDGQCFDATQPKSKTRRGRKMDKKTNCLTTTTPEFYLYKNANIRRLTPRECCRLQTIPEEETNKILSSGVSDSQIYKMLGNGWTVEVIAYILKHKMKEYNKQKIDHLKTIK